jgi:hypothetical protein
MLDDRMIKGFKGGFIFYPTPEVDHISHYWSYRFVYYFPEGENSCCLVKY